MERSRSEIDECVRRLDLRRLDAVAMIKVPRDLRGLAWRGTMFRPARRALGALWRAVVVHADMPSRESRERSSS